MHYLNPELSLSLRVFHSFIINAWQSPARCLKWTVVLTNQSINQSLFKIRQPEPIVTRPKQLEKNTYNTVQNL